MKSFLVMFFSLLLITQSCKYDQPIEPVAFMPDFSSYNCEDTLQVDDMFVMKHLKVIKSDTVLEIYMVSYDLRTTYYYPIAIIASPDSGTHTLYKRTSDRKIDVLTYSQKCCYSEPDQINKMYYVDDNDSLNNFVRLRYLQPNYITGSFKATVVNILPPNDTLRLKCDSFVCTY
jgi:hypothetical protein